MKKHRRFATLDTRDIGIEEVMTEGALCELFKMTTKEIETLRNEEELPFVELTEDTRLYFGPDIVDFLKKRQVRSEH